MLKFIQLCAAPWEGRQDGNLTFTLFGLTADGRVYRLTRAGWVAENMNVAGSNPTSDKSKDNEAPW